MRRVRLAGLGLFALLSFTLIGIHIYAEVFRYRVGHLLATLKTFQVEETLAATILNLRGEYQSNVTDDGPCSEEHCQFSIEIIEWESLIRITGNHPWAERPRYNLVWGLRFFGLRLNGFMARLRIEHGKLRSASIWLFPMSYIEHAYADGRGFLSSFSIRAGTVGNFRRWVGSRRVYEHPNLLVGKPSACTGCSGPIYAEFTWQASRDEYERALDINLSCITRIRDCRSPEEYLPKAAEVLKEDAADDLVHGWGKMPCDARMARILGRDSDLVNEVRVRRVREGDEGYVVVDYDVVKRLKGKEVLLRNIKHPKELAIAVAQSKPGPQQRLLQPGAERIIFLSRIFDKPYVESSCSVMPLTSETLAATLDGVADDRSSILGDE
jgi:hypothetical protein